MINRPAVVLLIVMGVTFVSCVTVRYDEDPSQYRDQIVELRSKLNANPNDADSWRELGVIYFETKQYQLAKQHLLQGRELNNADPKTAFYLGMTHEFDANPTAALAVYINYTDYSTLSEYRTLMEGRYQELTREVIRRQLQDLIAKEGTIATSALPATTMAVFPLAFQSGDAKYAPLGIGISEMIITDLAQVKKLKLVERIRIEELVKELRFSQSTAVEQASAPRIGRLLSAGQIVGGTFSVSPDLSLRMDVASVNVATGSRPSAASEADAVANLFRAEKEIVFKLLDEMGILLTKEERENIQRFPTSNLQAFLAYSLGLDHEFRGDFEAASAKYKEAGSIDPSFGLARERQATSESRKAAGSKESALASAQAVDPPQRRSAAAASTMITKRLGTIQQMIGSGFVPSQDSRKPAEEGLTSVPAELPPPPPPPLN